MPDTVGNPLDITGALTLEAWIYRDAQTDGFNGNNEGIISKWNGGTPGQRAFNLVYRPIGNHIRFLTSNTGLSVGAYDFPSPDNVIPLGEWTHVAATYIPSTRSALFVNGNLVAERTDPAGILHRSKASRRRTTNTNGLDGRTMAWLPRAVIPASLGVPAGAAACGRQQPR